MRTLKPTNRRRVPESCEHALEAFRARCASGDSSLQDFWNSRSGSQSLSTLAQLVKFDLQRRFGAGENPRVADYLDGFPDLAQDGDQVVSLVYEEFCLRREAGEDPDSHEFCEHYAPWRDSLLSQLAYHRDLSQLLETQPPPLPFPAIGDQFDKYTLEKLLGTGAAARVYLASEDELGGRKVVIKVSGCFGQEPSILGRLNHRNIVPILTVARSDSGLRGICMPYRAGLTLEELIRKLGRGEPPQKARRIWEILMPARPDETESLANRHPGWEKFPIDRTFSDAVAWIGLALSGALEYLHQEGVFHRDIKPANILLTHREGPQLLDFNLAENPGAADHVSASMKGGTLPYMAPEHLRAFLEVSGWKDVKVPADLYSLGLVLRELLTGTPPELPDPSLTSPRAIQELIHRRSRPMVPAREINPLIPPSLDAILQKCLAFEPSDRYETAKALSEDLRRFLERRSLRYAENASRVERAFNWIHRNFFLTSTLLVASLVLCGFLILRTPSSIPDRADFRRATTQLDSTKPADWDRARLVFDSLRHQFPDSAWPLLYLSLSLEKFGHQSEDKAKLFLKEASEKPDAEQAFLGRLEAKPDSAKLWTCYALWLTKRDRKPEARHSLQQAIDADPNHLMALAELINIERADQNHQRVIELVAKVIEIRARWNLRPDQIFQYRLIMLPSLATLAERTIDSGEIPAKRSQAAGLYDSIDATLRAMSDDLKTSRQGELHELFPYLNHFYSGLVASGRGFLATNARQFERANQCYDDAEHRFQEALLAIPPARSKRASDEGDVAKLVKVLADRRDRSRKLQQSP